MGQPWRQAHPAPTKGFVMRSLEARTWPAAGSTATDQLALLVMSAISARIAPRADIGLPPETGPSAGRVNAVVRPFPDSADVWLHPFADSQKIRFLAARKASRCCAESGCRRMIGGSGAAPG